MCVWCVCVLFVDLFQDDLRCLFSPHHEVWWILVGTHCVVVLVEAPDLHIQLVDK